jgi:hypothetical protein
MRNITGFVLTILLFAGLAGADDSLADAQELFYNGHYESAAAMTRTLSTDEGELAIYELRSSAVLFQIRRAIGEPRDKDKAFKACAACPELMTAFMSDLHLGQELAHEILKADPKDETALFFLGKLDLNYVWLVLGTLGRRTGWNEYWEARHSLDAVLVENPEHLRARVARAWIDYIVDTRMPWGTGWVLGGGNKKRALTVMREAADTEGDFYAKVEALFGLWDMQVREKNFKGALVTAQRLALLFPKNAELTKFIAAQTARDTR